MAFLKSLFSRVYPGVIQRQQAQPCPAATVSPEKERACQGRSEREPPSLLPNSHLAPALGPHDSVWSANGS